jgi:acetoacetate decarboxylase
VSVLSQHYPGYPTIPRSIDAAGTPLDNPTYGLPPAQYRDGEVLTFQYLTDPEAIHALLPEPLQPVNNVVQVQVSRWGEVPGAGKDLHECNVMVAARFDDSNGTVTGAYSPYFWVESDRAMAGGRELHGQPKRIATVQVETVGDLHVGRVIQNGFEIFTGTLQYKARPSSLERIRSRVDPITNLNLKIIHHIDGTQAIRQITARDLTDVRVDECYEGPCTVEIRPTATAPLFRLPVRSFLEGFYWRTDFRLVGGRVLHDFLSG